MNANQASQSEPITSKSEPKGSEGSLFDSGSTENQSTPTKTLLSSIQYVNRDDYEKFMENLTPDQAVIVLICSVNHCQSKGAFTIDESELLAKAIKALNKKG